MRIETLRQQLFAAANVVFGVPDSRLAPLIAAATKRGIYHACRSEEVAVAMAFGSRIGGKRPAVLMQDTGLGRCLQALLDLHRLYGVGVLLVVSSRDHEDEEPQHHAWRTIPGRVLEDAEHTSVVRAGNAAWKHHKIAMLVTRTSEDQ
jgi:sulfopyruvate decarboxylase TPP-binding subunit